MKNSQWDRLMQLWHQKKVPHALLFHGPRGTGKLALAKMFAQVLINNVVILSCVSSEGSPVDPHPDLILVQPEEGLISIQVVRQLREKITQTPHSGQYQCVIIDAAETMNIAASNALLKTLEEPTPSTVIILITAHPQHLPATLRSRCIAFAFPPPENIPSFEPSQERTDFISDFFAVASQQKDPLTIAEKWQKTEASTLLFWLLNLSYDLVRCKATAKTDTIVNSDVSESLTALARKVEMKTVFCYIETVYKNLADHRRRVNRNTTLQLESLMIEIYCLQELRYGRIV